MCTVSIIPIRSAALSHESSPCVRLACNRDESPSRPPATPPRVRACGDRRTLMPVDPVSEGTWIAANDAGLAFTLMNTYAQPFDRASFLARAGRYRSRGTIIPALLHCDTLEQAARQAAAIDPSAYPAFRLLILDRHRLVQVAAADERLIISSPARIERRFMFASSGLGDDQVTSPRQALFDAMFAGPNDDLRAAQDEFHRHRWPDRPHLSVRMHRPEARTVCLTIVELHAHAVRMIHYPECPDRAGEPFTTELNNVLSN